MPRAGRGRLPQRPRAQLTPEAPATRTELADGQNLLPLILFRPLRLLLSSAQLRTARIALLKATHLPFVAAIAAYERYRGGDGASGRQGSRYPSLGPLMAPTRPNLGQQRTWRPPVVGVEAPSAATDDAALGERGAAERRGRARPARPSVEPGRTGRRSGPGTGDAGDGRCRAAGDCQGAQRADRAVDRHGRGVGSEVRDAVWGRGRVAPPTGSPQPGRDRRSRKRSRDWPGRRRGVFLRPGGLQAPQAPCAESVSSGGVPRACAAARRTKRLPSSCTNLPRWRPRGEKIMGRGRGRPGTRSDDASRPQQRAL